MKTRGKSVIVVTIILELLILATIIYSILGIIYKDDKEVRIEHVFISLLGLALLYTPLVISKKWKLYIPSNLQIIMIVFIFAHFILGEIFRAYDYSILFDKILHTTSGIVMGAVGFSLVDLLNENKHTHLELSPFFVALFSFCFSMMIAAVWEVYEFSYDSIAGGNSQRWQIEGDIANIAQPGRYGLIDTMGDMIVCLVGSFIVSLAGYISLKTKNNWLNSIMIRSMKDVSDDGVKKENETSKLSDDTKGNKALDNIK